MTEHRRQVGTLTILLGFLLALTGASVLFDWLTTPTAWEVGVKGPVWLLLGIVLVLIGREFRDD